MFSARSEREMFHDGKTGTLYTPVQKNYSTVAFTDNLSGSPVGIRRLGTHGT